MVGPKLVYGPVSPPRLHHASGCRGSQSVPLHGAAAAAAATVGDRAQKRSPGLSPGLRNWNWLVVWLPFYIFPYIGLLIILIDFHIFQRGGPTTNQGIWIPFGKLT